MKIGKLGEWYLELWKRLTGWKLFLFYALHYTLLFLLLSRYIFAPFKEAGASFIWIGDGRSEYVPRMIYISQTIRDGIQSLLNGEGWEIPLYDFRVVPAQTNLQVEPLQWLAVFMPWDRIDVLYDFLVLSRYYLIGLAFSALGFYFKQDPLAVLIGAISYSFCGFTIYLGARHPFFVAPMILLPFLIIGAEKVLRGERAYIFTVSVFVSLIFNIYLSCMLAILSGLYIIVRYLCCYTKDGTIGFGKMMARAMVWGGTGILLSGGIWIPSIMQMLHTGRVGRTIALPFRYGADTYERMLTQFSLIANDASPASWIYLGFSVMAVPCVILLFAHKKTDNGRKSLRIMFVILTGMLCLPIVAYVMSGFNALLNRWSYAYALCVCVIIAVEIPQLVTERRGVLAAVGCGTALYMVICRFLVDTRNYKGEPIALLLMAFLLIGICYAGGESTRKFILPFCLFLTCVSVCRSAYLQYAPSQGNYVSIFVKKDEVYSHYSTGQYESLSNSERVQSDEEFFRVAASGLGAQEAPMSFYWGLNGTSFYSSTIASHYQDFQQALEILRQGQKNREFGNDARGAVLSLMNVKYYASRGNAPRPYGFKEIERIANGKNVDVILENEYALPIGYTYDTYIAQDEWERYSALDRQEAMLHSVILKDAPLKKDIVKQDVVDNAQKVPIIEVSSEGVLWNNGAVTVTQENAKMELKFAGIPESDTYLRVVNLDLTKDDSDRSWYLGASTGNTSTAARFIALGNIYAHGATTQMIYLGNSVEGYTTCTLNFPQKGVFVLDDLEIWCQPMGDYAEQIEGLRLEALKNVKTNWRGLTGTISVKKDKFLCFAIPYDKGWTAYVDGEKTNLVQANVGFMGIELPAGEHDIELKYWMPGLTAGITLSCIGIVCIMALGLLEHRRKLGMKKSFGPLKSDR